MRLAALIPITFFAALTGAEAGSAIPSDGYTSVPMGWYDMCREDPVFEVTLCARNNPNAQLLPFNKANMDILEAVNQEVNNTVLPLNDSEIWGEYQPEVWSYPVKIPRYRIRVGDCEDYVLEKLRMLEDLFPENVFVITVVENTTLDANGNPEGHAVLMARTDAGDYILDNLNSEVLAWEDTPYKYRKRQSDTNPNRWVALQNTRTPLAVSAN